MMMTNSCLRTAHRSPLRTAALAVGVVFFLVGIMGFIPGLTNGLRPDGRCGHDSMAKLLGVFQVSVLHNIVHLLFRLAGSHWPATIPLRAVPDRRRSDLYRSVGLRSGDRQVGVGEPSCRLNNADDCCILVLGIGHDRPRRGARQGVEAPVVGGNHPLSCSSSEPRRGN